MTDKQTMEALVMFVALMIFTCAGWLLGAQTERYKCLTESCQASCTESGYDASTLEDGECVCIQYSVMER